MLRPMKPSILPESLSPPNAAAEPAVKSGASGADAALGFFGMWALCLANPRRASLHETGVELSADQGEPVEEEEVERSR